MNSFTRNLSVLIIVFISAACVNAQTDATYKKEIDTWHAERVNELKADDGWLNLVGLFWLEEGRSSFGSGKQNKIVFPGGIIDEVAGYFERSGNTVTIFANALASIKVNDKPVSEALIFSTDSANTPIISSGNLRWTIIKRDNKIGIRLRNLKSPEILRFKGIDRYDVDASWKIPATLQTANQSGILITNVLGQTNEQKSPGKLVFTVMGRPYTLDALEEGDELFIIFGDSTSGNTTYPAGRFLHAKKPGPDGMTTIDFNKAYNPPCAFTEFATCPLPPKQNVLTFAVTAGEKYEPPIK